MLDKSVFMCSGIFLYNLVTTPKWMFSFLMYQGAFTILRRTFFLKSLDYINIGAFCIAPKLNANTGISNCLYIDTMLYTDNVECLPRNQYIFILLIENFLLVQLNSYNILSSLIVQL